MNFGRPDWREKGLADLERRTGRYGAGTNKNFSDDEIRAIRASHLGISELAKRYKVCRDTIYKVRTRKTYGHVE
jgi:hypothetical protein